MTLILHQQNISSYSTIENLFEQCFHDWYEGLHRYAFSLLKDNEEAKDIVQGVFGKLWEKRNEINIGESGRSWLYTTVHNVCLNTIRHKKVKDKYASQYRHSRPRIITADSVERREINTRINAAIEELPERCREVFLKSRFEGKKYAAIATEMNISVKTVEAQMGKALKVLREMLTDMITVAILTIVYF